MCILIKVIMLPYTAILVLLGLGALVIGGTSRTSTVNVPGVGQIKGLVHVTTDAPRINYYQYLGIPYGHAGRFEVAVPAAPFAGVFDATREGKACPQPLDNFQFPYGTSEACLVLSVATPRDPNCITTLLPVVVFVHGGAFLLGTSQKAWYDPELLVQEGAVVVQPNYRLGPFGFVTDGNHIPKNIGLKDVRCALRWVQANIQAFGGDPNRVTIYGESAGSAIVSALWFSNLQGLFHAVFSQSGVAISPWAMQKRPHEAYLNVLDKTRCANTSSLCGDEQFACLKTLTTLELNVGALATLGINDLIQVGVIDGLTAAIVQEDCEDPDAIITQGPLQQLQAGNIRTDVPLMFSVTSLEMLTFEPVPEILRFQSNTDVVPYGMMAADPEYVGGLIKQNYAGGELGWATSPPPMIIEYLGDVAMNFPTRYLVQHALPAMCKSAPIYVMEFSYASVMGRLNIPLTCEVGHADDLIYPWKMEFLTRESIAKSLYPPETFRKRLQFNRMLGNFIKYHNPTPTVDPDLDNLQWPAVQNSEHFQYLEFNHALTIKQDLKNKHYLFWLGTYQQFGNGKVSL